MWNKLDLDTFCFKQLKFAAFFTDKTTKYKVSISLYNGF